MMFILYFQSVLANLLFLAPIELNQKFPLGIPYQIANFGHLPYGLTAIVRLVYYPEHALFCQKQQQKDSSYPTYVLVEQSNCSLDKKSWIAQQSGYQGVLLIQSQNKSLMTNIGVYGFKVHIPCLIIDKKAGNILKQTIKENQVQMKVTFATRKRDKAQVIFFLDDNQKYRYSLLSDFAPFFYQLDYLDIRFVFRTVHKKYCIYCQENDCIGIYCLITQQRIHPVDGNIILKESLLQSLLLEQSSNQFFNFIELIHKHCSGRQNGLLCSLEYLQIDKRKQMQLNLAQQVKKVQRSESSIVQRWNQLIYQRSINSFPSVVINNLTYRGELSGADLFQFVCNSLTDPPQSCDQIIQELDFVSHKILWGLIKKLLLAALGIVLIVMACLSVFKLKKSRQLKQEMPVRINKMVSQYMQFQQSQKH